MQTMKWAAATAFTAFAATMLAVGGRSSATRQPTGPGSSATEADPDEAVEVVTRLIDLFSQGRMVEGFELYGDEVELSIEFALPRKIVMDRAVMQQWIDRSARGDGFGRSPMYEGLRVEDLVIHRTADPGVVIAEWTYVTPRPDGDVRNGNIIVVEVRDGKIVRSRDYHNDVTRAVADGRLGALLDQLRDGIG